MAANMQHMAGAGQMMPQQLRKPTASQLQQAVYQNIQQNTPPLNGMTWQSNFSVNERMGKTLDLITNITLAMGTLDYSRATDFGCQFEREVFHKSPTKEAYDQAMASKTMDFFKKRQANEPGLQNSLNASAQAQAHAQAQAQAQALMLQAQMGRGQTPQQGFQHMPHPMQATQMPQQQQQQQPSFMQQQQQQQQLAMGMANQAGRGIGPNPQAMGMAGGPNRNMFPNDVARLAQADKNKVMELATKMMAQATEQQKASTRLHLQSRLTAQQLAELQTQGRDPLVWWYQNQAFQALKQSSTMHRFQPPGPANPNNPQAAMMQQQQSQNSLQQQRQNMINAAQQPGAGHDFPPFTPNMDSIKDQQVAGLMAQQAGQVVVPASNGNGRNVTPQPGNQNISNQQMQNQTPRNAQQQQQQQQQAKLNQAAQQSQALQAQAQMKMQNQQQMTGNMATSQSPAMNTLNTPVSRPGVMNPMAPQGMSQNGISPFGDQRFHQGIQRPNNPAFNAMLTNMTPEQRQAINGLPPDKLNEVMRRWQNQRQEQIANMNANPMMQQQMANRPQNQFNQAGNMAPGPQNMQQVNAPGAGNQQQPMPMNRMTPQGSQLQFVMDSMDLPPSIINQINGLPAEVKKWRDLKVWISQNNTLPPTVRGQLAAFQQKQFQVLMQRRAASVPQQPGQAINMNPAMPMQVANQQPGIQRQMANLPPQLLQVSPQEMMHIRSQKPGLVNVPDEQLRSMIISMKRSSWQQQQQQQQLRAQQLQAQNQQLQAAAANNMAGAQGPQNPMQIQQTQPNLTPQQTQAQTMPNAMSQTASMQAANLKQQPNANQARNNQSQAAKTLKRPNPDDGADAANMKASISAARQPPAPSAAAASQPTQQPVQRPGAKFPPQLTPQQEAQLNPEQRARYEQILRMQGKAPAPAATGAVPSESLMRLKMIGQEEQKLFAQESTPDIPMGPEEYAETAAKLKRIVQDMSKVGRGLSKWYSLTQDDARAKMFFRTRLRLIKQHVDGEKMEIIKDAFSIRSSELDQARAMLESMAKDLAASVAGGRHLKPGSQTQAQPLSQQQMQQAQQKNQLTQPAPLNAANLEKNAQAMNKLNQQQKQANKAGQVPPPAPTSAQPPFPFGAATSPDGNPTYMSKPKEINLQLPPARKKPRLTNSGPSSQVATPSPQISKNASPDIQRQQGPPKPLHLCTEPDCDQSISGFPSKQALQHHIDEEHTKPKADPYKFVGESLAEALGLELDGTIKKEQKEGAQAMSLSTSKQGQSSGNLVGTPMSVDGTGMKRSASAMSKAQDVKAGVKLDATAKAGDGKQVNGTAMLVNATDPWANSTIDPQTLLQNLGFENGLPNIVNEANMYRSFTPKDTPESSKDGASEPNSDISEGAALDIDMNWHTLDNDVLMDFTNACINGEMDSTENLKAAVANIDPTLLLAGPPGVPDWDEIQVDFTKPFELDMSLYSLDVTSDL
ncbi:hypothetical protein M441DRAFT_128525 [Trichoderma asperellum CBS 433.97]|uniref:Mediator complex subunit 15 KIX domain-containing protein n=1 Tax=Trichoderma asperellum (strain ATCC 204424 / CBS 433.97 / NBRC 101777) TaxID=1042311 RepID=A0A2T3ZN56_TRIA4|nr:hypothetical protein M441DRAFT_128525 [Trichoderma asperellum CBS 433.97]PTB46245.1 hypothetical protein M441DRAFT_128525 [Trichoderma asperellum CBS 433.97]